MNKFFFYFIAVLVGAVGCTNNEPTNKVYVQQYNQPDTSVNSFSLNTRQDIDNIPNGYGLKGFRRTIVNGKIIETKGTLARLREKDIQDSQYYYGGSILPGELEIIPPEMIRPLDGSEGNPLYLNVVTKFVPVAPFPSLEKIKEQIQNSPPPKYIIKCSTFNGATTCTIY